jgi:mRNA-degrading endonuclease RelE of RelBE toxin-antitoxin system
MRIVYLRDARSFLRRLPANIRDRFLEAFEDIAAGHGEKWDTKQLAGRPESRLRVSGFRAIYRIDGDVLTVTLIGPRGDVYKK